MIQDTVIHLLAWRQRIRNGEEHRCSRYNMAWAQIVSNLAATVSKQTVSKQSDLPRICYDMWTSQFTPAHEEQKPKIQT